MQTEKICRKDFIHYKKKGNEIIQEEFKCINLK